MRRTTRSLAALLIALVTVVTVFVLQHGLRADSNAQSLPLVQDWSDTTLITTDNNWSGVPGIVGYRGDDLTTATGTDPQTILADGTNTPVNVIANALSTSTTGGVLEVTGANPTIAIQGSGTADAPFILISLNTAGFQSINVSYNLRDLDASSDNAVQQVALHYRVGSSVLFTNIPAGYVADATTGPSLATLVTPVNVTLPAAADNQPLVQIRIMTTNAVGNDELVGIDDVSITGTPLPSSSPSAVGTAFPSSVIRGHGSTLLTAAVTPGTSPASTGLTVAADLTAIGGSSSQALFDDGTHGDVTAGDNTFSFAATVPVSAGGGLKTFPAEVTDAELRSGSFSIALTVLAPEPLPFTQDWSNTSAITAADDWSGVPGIVGYQGNGLVSSEDVDPQSVLADGSSTTVDVNANRADPNTFTTGGVTEFDGIANPTIALQGSATASAPHIVLTLDTTAVADVQVSYNLRDLDGSGDNAVQPVALQYRVGPSGPFTNVPAGFAADATDGPNLAGRVTPVLAHLPAAAGNQPFVQVRIITTNASGSDEWVGIDDITVTDGANTTDPTATGTASPSSVSRNETTLLTVAVTPGANPASTGISVTANLSLIGGSSAQTFFDDGTHGDANVGDHVFSYQATVSSSAALGLKALAATINDDQNRSATTDINLTIVPADPSVALIPPAALVRGFNATFHAIVTPGLHPLPTGISATIDLSALLLSNAVPMYDDGTHGDPVAGDRDYIVSVTVPASLGTSVAVSSVTISDSETFTVQSAPVTMTVVDPSTPLPFRQDWSNISLITSDNTWSAVPGIIGYRGDDLTTATGTDPRTIVADGSGTPINVIANQSNPNTLTTGGVAEFDGIANPTIALNGSGTSDAPHIVIRVSTLGTSQVRVSYNLRDLDASTDNSVQPVALQYRVGGSGNYTNIPAAFVADASSGPSLATLVTPVSVLLPPGAVNQPLVELRIITTNAVGNDEWIGIDDISVLDPDAPTGPTGFGTATPNQVDRGSSTLFTVAVTPGTNPTSTGLGVVADLSAIGGNATQTFFDNGTNGDATAGDNTFSFLATVATTTALGPATISGLISDAQARSSTFTIGFTVTSPPVVTTIATIQGTGSQSPLKGQAVVTSGVVTGVKNNGFFIETPDTDQDLDPLTSEGVFVFTSSAPPAAASVGNLVRVAGTVQEFVPNADPFQPPVTEIGLVTNVTLLATGQPLPTPVTLTAADTTATGGMEQLERFEGMRVHVDSITVIGPTLGSVNEANATATSNGVFYGVITGIARPLREPGIELPNPLPAGAPPNVPRFDGNPERLQVDTDGQVGALRFDVAAADVVTGVTGPLDYAFRTYVILPDPTTPPHVTVNRPSPAPVDVPGANQFTIASANMERFFDTTDDPGKDDAVLTQTAFNNRLNKASLFFHDVLRTPDIVGVEEMENLTTLQAIAAKVNADAVVGGQPDPGYQAYLVEGNDIGGIDVGFLVKRTRVDVVDVTQINKSSTYINPLNNQPELLNDRPSLVLRAQIHRPLGGVFPVTVIVNHLRSLSGVDDPVDGARVRAKRRAQAEELASFIQSRQLADPSEQIVSIGDYNAFQFNDGLVDSIGTITGKPAPADQVLLASPDLVDPDLIDLVETVPPQERYSFVFDGNAQELDHVLITQNLLSRVDGLQYGRVDADFPETARNDAGAPKRLSDHDPLVAFFNFPAASTTTTVTSSQNPSALGDPVTFTATVSAGSVVPTGSVTFMEGATTLSVITLNGSAQAQFATSTLAIGLHPIEARFTGNGAFSASTATLTQIVNPTIAIDDVTVQEPSSGSTGAVFTVTLSGASDRPVSVNYATNSGTAIGGSDFTAVSGTLMFAPGQVQKPITVPVLANGGIENSETFTVDLSSPFNATLLDGSGVGTIFDSSAPRIDAFAPTAGVIGSLVTISGANFIGITEVQFNGQAATFVVHGHNRIIATVPAGASDGPISVSSARGTATSTNVFRILPKIDAFSPASGAVGTLVTINGTGLSGTTAVRFNGTAASIQSVTATSVKATVPAGASTGKITLTTPNGTAQSAHTFLVAPGIESFAPASGVAGTIVTITGANFTGATTVRFGAASAPFVIVSDTQIRATVPLLSSTAPLTVMGPGGSATSATAFVVLPQILFFAPAAGTVGSQVLIAGTNFNSVTGVKFGTVTVTSFTSFTVLGLEVVVATVPPGAASARISVTAAAGTAISSGTFTVIP